MDKQHLLSGSIHVYGYGGRMLSGYLDGSTSMYLPISQ